MIESETSAYKKEAIGYLNWKSKRGNNTEKSIKLNDVVLTEDYLKQLCVLVKPNYVLRFVDYDKTLNDVKKSNK